MRIRGTESETFVEERLTKAKLEMESATQFDVVMVNDDLESAQKEMHQLVRSFIEQE